MLFNKKIEPSCSYCDSGVRISETEVACVKRGVMSSSDSCRRFRYDPLKREPAHPAALISGTYTEKDFEI